MNANISSATIILSKAEAKAAGKTTSAEFAELNALRAAYPTFRIVIRASKSKDNMKGLTVEYMKKYNSAHDDENGSTMKVFNSLRGIYEDGATEFARVATYGELKMWFLDTYPEIEDMNKTVNDILAKAKRSREAKRMAAKQAA